MTQMTFDFSTFNQPASCSLRVISKPTAIRETAPASQSPASQSPSSQSLSLYDANRTEIQHIGDLAQQVLARYDIVHRRRAARLARERAARENTTQKATAQRLVVRELANC